MKYAENSNASFKLLAMLTKLYCASVFCFIIVLGFEDCQSNRVFINRQKFEKLPGHGDLNDYLGALDRVIDYSGENKNDIDINFYLGLFLANVNLKRALQEKYQVLPKKLHSYVKDIIRKTENLLDFYKLSIDRSHDLRNSKYKAILTLLMNTTIWTNRLPKFHMNLINETAPLSDMKKVEKKWIVYRRIIDDRNAWVPNPHQSDLCLSSLATNEGMRMETSRRCRVLKSCYEMLENGTDFGYALAHRLLFMQQARFSRGCTVFTKLEDDNLRRRFCLAAYQEVQFIAEHNFEVVDILLEHVCLCGLEGYAHFLKRSWLTKILGFQTKLGCFSQKRYNTHKIASSYLTVGNIGRPVDQGIGVHCNGHTSAVAAGTLALASRFILEYYY